MTDALLVFGATGRCGRAFVERALAGGHTVTAFVRSPDRARRFLDSNHASLRIVEGDVRDRARVTDAIAGHDAVISCLASFEPPHDQMSTLTGHVVHAASALDRPRLRYITYSLCGVARDGDWISHAIQNSMRVFSRGKFGPAIADHLRVIERLEASTLAYTLVQTATMIDKPVGSAYRSGSAQQCPGARLWHRLGLLDAAQASLDVLHTPDVPKLYVKYV